MFTWVHRVQWAIVNGVTGSFYIKRTRPFSVDKGKISKMSNLKKKKSFKMSLKNPYIYNWFKLRKNEFQKKHWLLPFGIFALSVIVFTYDNKKEKST